MTFASLSLSSSSSSHKNPLSETFTFVDSFKKPKTFKNENQLFPTYFLTHFHSDHYAGLAEDFTFGKIYATKVTAELIVNVLGVNRKYVERLELNECYVIEDSLAGEMNVTLIDANHCPGSAMILFEGKFGAYLHTGDFRYYKELFDVPCLKKYIQNQGKASLTRMFLDVTFAHPNCQFCTKEESIKQLIDLIDEHPNERICLNCGWLGTEELIEAVAEHTQQIIGVCSQSRLKELRFCLPHVNFCFVAGGTQQNIQNEKQNKKDGRNGKIPRILITNRPFDEKSVMIKASALWYKIHRNFFIKYDKKRPLQDMYGRWHILWSMHSSFPEIKKFIRKIKCEDISLINDIIFNPLECKENSSLVIAELLNELRMKSKTGRKKKNNEKNINDSEYLCIYDNNSSSYLDDGRAHAAYFSSSTVFSPFFSSRFSSCASLPSPPPPFSSFCVEKKNKILQNGKNVDDAEGSPHRQSELTLGRKVRTDKILNKLIKKAVLSGVEFYMKNDNRNSKINTRKKTKREKKDMSTAEDILLNFAA